MQEKRKKLELRQCKCGGKEEKKQAEEATHLSERVRHVVQVGLHLPAVAVAALEGLDHGWGGEGQQQEPDDDGDLWGLFQDLDKVPPAQVHHVEVAVNGQHDEEGDARAPVEEEHEEHGLAGHIVIAAPQLVAVVVGFEGKAGHQQEVGHHDVEEEDALVPPELEPVERKWRGRAGRSHGFSSPS